MEKKIKKRIVKLILGSGLAFFCIVLFLLFGRKTKPVNEEITLCTLDGDIITMDFDLTWVKTFRGNTYVTGIIAYEGEKYEAQYQKGLIYINSNSLPQVFIHRKTKDHSIIMYNVTEDFRYFSMRWEGKTYYGPAQNAVEAEDLSKKLKQEALR